MWDEQTRPRKLLTFRSGGWVLLLTAVLMVLILLIIVGPALRRLSDRPPGDGKDPATYGFDLGSALIRREAIVAAQLHRDLLEALGARDLVAGVGQFGSRPYIRLDVPAIFGRVLDQVGDGDRSVRLSSTVRQE